MFATKAFISLVPVRICVPGPSLKSRTAFEAVVPVAPMLPANVNTSDA